MNRCEQRSIPAAGDALPLAQAQADVVVPSGDLHHIARTVLQARATLRVIRQNLLWAAAYNALCVPLAMMGRMPAWMAGLGMALSSLAVVLNAARLLRWPPAAGQELPFLRQRVPGRGSGWALRGRRGQN